MNARSENDRARRARTIRLAILLGLFALGVYGGFIALVGMRGGL